MAIKPNFLASMGYQYFLSYGAPLKGNSVVLNQGGGQKTPIAPGTFFVSESSNKK